MDGAHNEDAAKKLAASIETYFPRKKLFYIMGVFKDKEYEKIIRITAPYAARDDGRDTGKPKGASERRTGKKAWEVQNVPVMTFEKKIEKAVKENMEKGEKDEVILAFGSLSFLGEAEKQ